MFWTTFDDDVPRDRLALLLEELSKIEDDREPCKIMYPIGEVLFLIVCGTICSCDDFDEIVLWGEQNIDFLKTFSEFHFGIPGARWLRILLNRMDPSLFARCFESWIAAVWPGRHELISIDGKTARRTHDRARGLGGLHTLSAYASTARLILAQTSVPEKANEITAIPELLDQLAAANQLKGAVVTIDAMGTQFAIANKILELGAHYMLPLKGNQPTLAKDVEDYFKTAPAKELVTTSTLEKGHGRIERRTYIASSHVDWIASDRSFPGQSRFKGIKTIVKVEDRTELRDKCSFDTRYYITSIDLDIERISKMIRGHWGVESVHWSLDVTFNEDLSRYRARSGAKNMAVVRRFAFNLLKQATYKTGKKPGSKATASMKSKRKIASWSPDFLLTVLNLNPC
jgi:predicted transposase YbfD/YdcC